MAAHVAVTAHNCVVPVRLLNCQSFKISKNKGEQIISFQIFYTDAGYFPHDLDKHIGSLGSEILDSKTDSTKTPLKHDVELNLDETTLNDRQRITPIALLIQLMVNLV